MTHATKKIGREPQYYYTGNDAKDFSGNLLIEHGEPVELLSYSKDKNEALVRPDEKDDTYVYAEDLSRRKPKK